MPFRKGFGVADFSSIKNTTSIVFNYPYYINVTFSEENCYNMPDFSDAFEQSRQMRP